MGALFNRIRKYSWPWYFFLGLLLALSFAPFHLAGMATLSLSFFYYGLIDDNRYKTSFINGLALGLGFFSLGVSWVYVSIHEYGHLNVVLASFITFLFLLYLALFPALTSLIFSIITRYYPINHYHPLLFAALWVLSEYWRANLFTGFPWLAVGFGQIDGPFAYLLPVVGVFGVSFITAFIAALFVQTYSCQSNYRYGYLAIIIALLVSPMLLKSVRWTNISNKALSVGIIQANLSMRDKWDDTLFWQLLHKYQKATEKLLGTQLIVMPESAIPLPAHYVSDFLSNLNQQARKVNSAILLGIPQSLTQKEQYYYNTLSSLGQAHGTYIKQHLVPFGEYMPKSLLPITQLLGVPNANLRPATTPQTLITIHHRPIASLICYELGYGELLRHQLPNAQWIVSISDDGWFGHSLAIYQQLQMAQVSSITTGRYHVMANNDGLSSIINTQGTIIATLPAFSAGILQGIIFPAYGQTPWVYIGDKPLLYLAYLIVLIALLSIISDKVVVNSRLIIRKLYRMYWQR